MPKPDPERQERERQWRIWLNEIDASMNENLAPWLKAFTTVLQTGESREISNEHTHLFSAAVEGRETGDNGGKHG